ncbi:hypothetical protein T265_02413 [Opisthorchis viverrini]|uniref:Uncharacterized protein n=1 Tax=Opisthorchis viverrini TaxID=6198 RepID=A0A075AIB9_OPIVI|nr:hypothetical protein T265_02413 [Opisthorchis viverrini]KER31364.1 hypothetical protein T265_02413 [Opisthorchis viverrini]
MGSPRWATSMGRGTVSHDPVAPTTAIIHPNYYLQSFPTVIDFVNRQKVWQCLFSIRVLHKFLTLLKALYADCRGRVKVYGNLLPEFTTGVMRSSLDLNSQGFYSVSAVPYFADYMVKNEAAWCSTFNCLKTSQKRDSAGFQRPACHDQAIHGNRADSGAKPVAGRPSIKKFERLQRSDLNALSSLESHVGGRFGVKAYRTDNGQRLPQLCAIHQLFLAQTNFLPKRSHHITTNCK